MSNFVTFIVKFSPHLNSDPFQVTDSDVQETNVPSNFLDVNADKYDFINIVLL